MPGSTVGFRRAALHLGALWALAFVQPMFGLLGGRAGAEFFIARGNTMFDIVVFALAYTLVPPLLGAGVVWVVGRIRPGLDWGVHLLLVAVLVAALVLPPLGDALSGSAASIAVALLVGAAVAYAYVRAAVLRTFLTVLAAAPLVFLVLFLFFSQVSDLLSAGEASAAVDGPATSSTPIVHIVLDELPVSTLAGADGRIDASLYPNLAKFAAGATWYRHATSVADTTPEAVPAQLTGLRPKVGELPTSTSHPHSLFTLFGRSHAVAAAEPITDVCPAEMCAEARQPVRARLSALAKDLKIIAGHLLLPGDVAEHLPPIDRGWLGFASETDSGSQIGGMTAPGSRAKLLGRVIERIDADDARVDFARVIADLDRKSSRPPLVFMHSTLPHGPSRFLPDGHGYTVNRGNYPGLTEGRWTGPQWLVDHNFERHVLQTMYTDALVGELLDKVREKGIYDKAVILITADHGEAFRTGEPRRRISETNIPDIAVVPFIVKLPGQRAGKVDDRPVLTVDALPTLAKAAGVEPPWDTDGMPADERPATSDEQVQLFDDGKPGTRYPLSQVLDGYRDRQAYERRILRGGPYGIGPRPDLLGRSVEATPPDDAIATLDEAGAYDHVDPSAAALPALVTGDVDLPEDTPLAIAVNGRVEATTRVFLEGKSTQYVAMVPPETLDAGKNTITVLQIMDDGTLKAIGGTTD